MSRVSVQEAMRTPNAHKMVAHLCEEMAQEVYERLALNNDWYERHQDRSAYVKGIAPTLREEARRILSEMLGRNDVSETEKRDIYEALLLDQTLPNNHVIRVEDTIH